MTATRDTCLLDRQPLEELVGSRSGGHVLVHHGTNTAGVPCLEHEDAGRGSPVAPSDPDPARVAERSSDDLEFAAGIPAVSAPACERAWLVQLVGPALE